MRTCQNGCFIEYLHHIGFLSIKRGVSNQVDEIQGAEDDEEQNLKEGNNSHVN